MRSDQHPPILWDLADGVATITLNRPQRRNAWNFELEELYFAAVFRAAREPEVRAVVITGHPDGRAFCPGLDTDDLAALTSQSAELQRNRWPHTLLTMVPKPVVVAINGACAGLGLVQALFADVRFVQAGSRLSTAFARRGLPAENAIAWVLARLAGHAVATDLLLSGRTFTGEEAHELGIVNRVVPADELVATATAYARDIAENCSPGAMAQIKRQIYTGLDTDLETARRVALDELYVHRLEADFVEGVASYREKRSPRFEGLSVDLDATVSRDS